MRVDTFGDENKLKSLYTGVICLMNSFIFFFRKAYDSQLKGKEKRGRIVNSHELSPLDAL